MVTMLVLYTTGTQSGSYCSKLHYELSGWRDIQLTLFQQLEDIDFADDCTILPHTHDNMEDKVAALDTSASTRQQ